MHLARQPVLLVALSASWRRAWSAGTVYDTGSLHRTEKDARLGVLDRAKRCADPGKHSMITSYDL